MGCYYDTKIYKTFSQEIRITKSYVEKEGKTMVEINRHERDAIIEKYPGVHIVGTMKQRSGRGRYYCEESKKVMRLLRELRKGV